MSRDKFKSFQHMSKTLRAGAASGMDTVITLEPESAAHLAEILEDHEKRLALDLLAALGQEYDAHPHHTDKEQAE